MYTQDDLNYQRIAAAIVYIKSHFKEQPNLEQIAEKVNLSPAHFQRLFTAWAGTSPKKFLQYISITHAKQVLKAAQPSTLFDTTFETGLSSTSRLHDLFVQIEGMSPAEYKNEGKHLHIDYRFADSPFGQVLVAATAKGICDIAFVEEPATALATLKAKFAQATFTAQHNEHQEHALAIFDHDWSQLPQIKLHLKGTPFQLKVWEALLKIPMGALRTYGSIAHHIGQPSASRAVGTAIGSNPVAFLIPCHRVIQATGTFGGYMWGNTRKTAMIGWEAAQTDLNIQL